MTASGYAATVIPIQRIVKVHLNSISYIYMYLQIQIDKRLACHSVCGYVCVYVCGCVGVCVCACVHVYKLTLKEGTRFNYNFVLIKVIALAL